MFQWLIVAILVYVIYYLVNKYEKKLNTLNEMIEFNSSKITTNKDLIEQNKSKIDTHHTKITRNREHIDINQEILSKLKD